MGGILGKIVGNKYGLLVLGIILLGAGFWQLNQTEVTCGGEVMVQGDICQSTRRGNTTENTYDEEKASQQLTGKILLGVGGAMTVGGAGWIIAGLVRPKREEEVPSTDPVAAA